LRILLDESVPLRLATALAGHGVRTVRQEQWLGLRNSVLLRVAVSRGFEVVITMDASLRYQQNLPAIGIEVVVIRGIRNRLADLRILIPQIQSALLAMRPGDVVEISPRRTDSVRDAVLLPGLA
jgi:hypothetical protein